MENDKIESMVNGKFANILKKSASHTIGGIFVGAIIGYGIATIFGGSRLMLPFFGGIIGGRGGYLISKKTNG